MLRSFKVFTLFDIPVYLHSTFLLMLLIVSVANPTQGLLFLTAFTFVLFHEFGHCLAAKYCNLEAKSITMLPFGGLAQIGDSSVDPRKELFVTIAGPLVNAVFAILLSIPILMIDITTVPEWLSISIIICWWINMLLFVFNLLPCFPLDGGRIFRALLNLYWGDKIRATRVAVIVGRFFACGMMAAGVYFSIYMWVILGLVLMFLANMEKAAIEGN